MQIGATQPADDLPSSSGNVVFMTFEVASETSLPGARALASIVRDLETDEDMRGRLDHARRLLGGALSGPHNQLRVLRLRRGLSQATLATLATTTQSYIARLESGTVDPGTDMVVRIAGALHVTQAEVFDAVRQRREHADG